MESLKSKIKTWKQNRKNKQAKKLFQSNSIIKFAFSCGGIDYYQHDDIFSLPYERGLTALAYYNELNMRCSREYLLKHVEAIRNVLHKSGNKIDVFAINALNEQMQARLDLVTDTDLMYKLASVVFFDKNENPCIYEENYSKKKIENWKRNNSVSAFFLQMPLVELIPFLKSAEIDLNTYSELNTQMNEIHNQKLEILANIHTKSSKD